MQRFSTKNFKLTSFLAKSVTGMLLATSAYATQPLSIQMAASQVVTENGKPVLKTVSKAKSGDIIQYQATYQNNLDKNMTDVSVNIPVPTNMVYTGVGNPAPTAASLDGKKFEAIPLQRMVNGKLVDIPLSEYRAVRWVVKVLPSHKQAVATVNMKVK